jgi:protein-arginine kinase activator protein McsA
MLCQKCQQAPATIHLKSLKACRQIESHYCEPCSRTLDLGYPVSPAPPPPPPSR